MAKSATGGNNAQFTYDFGIAIAQSTVNKLTRLTGAALTLASAFYALKSSATEYVETLRNNALRFGGVLSTLNAIEKAQDRLLKGQSYFKVDDQLSGMNRLMSMGINAKDNLEWVNKAAHATGKSFTEFSNAITAGIGGNMQALVDMGLLTQRATRMFDKYQANTIMRQRAILNFVKSHKGLMNAVKNDFETIQDQTRRIQATWKAFLKSIIGKPNDPDSFYGQVVSSMKFVAEALSRNVGAIKRYGYVIGQVLGWVIKQIGQFVVWVGRKAKNALESVWKVTDNFKDQSRSLLVWLEFWKLKVLDFFKKYGDEIKLVLKLLIAYKALKYVFVIGKAAIASVIAYRKAIQSVLLLQKAYLASMGPLVGTRFSRWLQSLAAFMPRWARKMWVSLGKFIERGFSEKIFAKFFRGMYTAFKKGLSSIGRLFTFKGMFSALGNVFKFLGKGFKFVIGVLRNIPSILGAALKAGKGLWVALNSTNPIGWIILAITLFVVLYTKVKAYRDWVNLWIKSIVEVLKILWNSIMWLYVQIRIGLSKIWSVFKEYVWNPISDFFSAVGDWIGRMWSKFKDTSIGRWISRNIVDPLVSAFTWISELWDGFIGTMTKVYNWLTRANKTVVGATEKAADKHGISVITWGGKDDGTTPIKTPDTPATPSTPVTPTASSNPIVDTQSSSDYTADDSSGSTTMTFDKGAVQIIVQKGEGIDEDKLARKIQNVIEEMERTKRKRGGM